MRLSAAALPVLRALPRCPCPAHIDTRASRAARGGSCHLQRPLVTNISTFAGPRRRPASTADVSTRLGMAVVRRPLSSSGARGETAAGWDDSGWNAMFTRLEKFYREKNHCNVPKCWAPDLKLGEWVSTQRVSKKRLDEGEASPGITAERVQRLDELGFEWDRRTAARWDDSGWNAMFARLEKFYREKNHCNVPKGWAPDTKLAKWVSTQRVSKKRLDEGEASPITAERVQRLDELGFEWDRKGQRSRMTRKVRQRGLSHQQRWDTRFGELQEFRKDHGHCNVPQDWAPKPGLGKWVNHQRTSKKRLDEGKVSPGITAERVQRLDELGFEWELRTAAGWNDRGWDEMFTQLEAYQKKYGDCNVPFQWSGNRVLATWVSTQRRAKKRLDASLVRPQITAERVQRLDKLEFEWVRPRGRQMR
eukprot:COSAG01_NODE_1006_length_12163_cov_237.845669_18_plen_420_part_00